MIEVEGPDGAINEFPAGTPDATITKALRKVYGMDRTDQLREQIPEYARATASENLLHSATFNTLDEITGAVSAPFAVAKRAITGGDEGKSLGQRFGDAYARNRDAERARLELYRRENPEAALATDLGGGLMVGGGAAFVKGAGKLANIGRGIATGAGYGAAAGAGGAEGGAAERMQGAKTGAAWGAALGGALPLAGAVASPVTSRFGNAIRGRTAPREYAIQKVAEKLDDAGITPATAANRISRAQANTGQQMSLADVGGDSTRDLLRATTNIPGPARNRVSTTIGARDLAQGDRIKRVVRNVFEDPEGYGRAVDDIVQRRMTEAAPHYRQAYQKPIMFTQKLDELLQRPAGKAALARARTIAENEGVPFQQWFARIDDAGNIIQKNRVPDMRAWDYIKRGLDDVVEADAAALSPFGGTRNTAAGRAVKSLRKELLSELDRLNPDYAKARAISMDNIQAQEALEFGRKAFTQTPEQVRRAMAGFTDGQREAAQIGFAEAIRSKVDSAGVSHNALNRFFNNRNQIATVKAMFGDNTTEFARFREAMMNEARMRKTSDRVRGNSSTTKQMADLMDASGLDEMVGAGADLAAGRGVQAALQFVKSRMARLGGFTPEVADNVAKILLSRGPNSVRALTDEISRIERAYGDSAAARTAVSRAIQAALGIQADQL